MDTKITYSMFEQLLSEKGVSLDDMKAVFCDPKYGKILKEDFVTKATFIIPAKEVTLES